MSARITITAAQALAILDHHVEEAGLCLARYLWNALAICHGQGLLNLIATAQLTPAQIAKTDPDEGGPSGPWTDQNLHNLAAAMKVIREGLRTESTAALDGGEEPHITEVRFARIGIMLAALSKLNLPYDATLGEGEPEAGAPVAELVKAANAMRLCLQAVLACPELIGKDPGLGHTYVVTKLVDMNTPRKDLNEQAEAWRLMANDLSNAASGLYLGAASLEGAEANSPDGQALALRSHWDALHHLWDRMITGPMIKGKRSDLGEAEIALQG